MSATLLNTIGLRASLLNAEKSVCIISALIMKNIHTKKDPLVCNGTFCKLTTQKDKVKKQRKSNESLQQRPSSYYSSIIRRYYSNLGRTDRERRQRDESDSDSDSDSDTECKSIDRSKFWRRKMRTLHNILDVNKDGLISYNDFQLLADRFKSLGHLDEKHAADFTNIIQLTWEQQWGSIDERKFVTVEQYLDDMHHVLNDKSLKKKAHSWLPYLFRAVDKDQSGFISVNEFKLFFECLGLDSEHAAVSFAVIDTNGDGKLSIKEFVKLGKEYYFSDDEKKVSRMFWGPLVDH